MLTEFGQEASQVEAVTQARNAYNQSLQETQARQNDAEKANQVREAISNLVDAYNQLRTVRQELDKGTAGEERTKYLEERKAALEDIVVSQKNVLQSLGEEVDSIEAVTQAQRNYNNAITEGQAKRKDAQAIADRKTYLSLIDQEAKAQIKVKNAEAQVNSLTGSKKAMAKELLGMEQANLSAIQQQKNALAETLGDYTKSAEVAEREAAAKREVLQAQINIKEEQSQTNLFTQLGATIIGRIKTMMSQLLVQMTIGQVQQFWQKGWEYAEDYYNKLNEIQVVTMKTTQETEQLGKNIRNLAENLSVSSADLITSATTYYRQGLDDDEVQKRLIATTEYAKAANVAFDTAAEHITAATNALGAEAQHVADVYLMLGDSAASSGSEIAAAMTKASATAQAAGVSFEELSTMITVVSESTRQEASSIGTALNAMMARWTNVKNKGYNADDATKVNDIAKALDTVNIRLMDSEGNWGSMSEIFQKISEQWDTLDNKTQNYIATTIAGTKQQNVFRTIMNDMSKSADEGSRYYELLAKAINSAGTASEKYAIYEDSVQAATDRLTASAEKLYSFFNANILKNLKNIQADINEALYSMLTGEGQDNTRLRVETEESVQAIEKLRDRYVELAEKENKTAAEEAEMISIVKELSSENFTFQNALDNMGNSADTTSGKIQAMNQALQEQLDLLKALQLENLNKSLTEDIDNYNEAVDAFVGGSQQRDLYSTYTAGLQRAATAADSNDIYRTVIERVEDLQKIINNLGSFDWLSAQRPFLKDSFDVWTEGLTSWNPNPTNLGIDDENVGLDYYVDLYEAIQDDLAGYIKVFGDLRKSAAEIASDYSNLITEDSQLDSLRSRMGNIAEDVLSIIAFEREADFNLIGEAGRNTMNTLISEYLEGLSSEDFADDEKAKETRVNFVASIEEWFSQTVEDISTFVDQLGEIFGGTFSDSTDEFKQLMINSLFDFDFNGTNSQYLAQKWQEYKDLYETAVIEQGQQALSPEERQKLFEQVDSAARELEDTFDIKVPYRFVVEDETDNSEAEEEILQRREDLYTAVAASLKKKQLAQKKSGNFAEEMDIIGDFVNSSDQEGFEEYLANLRADWEELYNGIEGMYSDLPDLVQAMKEGDFDEATRLFEQMKDSVDEVAISRKNLIDSLGSREEKQALQDLVNTGFVEWLDEINGFISDKDSQGMYEWLMGQDSNAVTSFLDKFPAFTRLFLQLADSKGDVSTLASFWTRSQQAIDATTDSVQNYFKTWDENRQKSQKVTDEQGLDELNKLYEAMLVGSDAASALWDGYSDSMKEWLSSSDAGDILFKYFTGSADEASQAVTDLLAKITEIQSKMDGSAEAAEKFAEHIKEGVTAAEVETKKQNGFEKEIEDIESYIALGDSEAAYQYFEDMYTNQSALYQGLESYYGSLAPLINAIKNSDWEEASAIFEEMTQDVEDTTSAIEKLKEKMDSYKASQGLQALADSNYQSWIDDIKQFFDMSNEDKFQNVEGFHDWLLGKDPDTVMKFLEAYPEFFDMFERLRDTEDANIGDDFWVDAEEALKEATDAAGKYFKTWKAGQKETVSNKEGIQYLNKLSLAMQDTEGNAAALFNALNSSVQEWMADNAGEILLKYFTGSEEEAAQAILDLKEKIAELTAEENGSAQAARDYADAIDKIKDSAKSAYMNSLGQAEIDSNFAATYEKLRNIVGYGGLDNYMDTMYNGNAGLSNRPTVDASKLTKAGWGDTGEGIATVFSSHYGGRDFDETPEYNMNVVIGVTPILPDGKVLTPDQLDEYVRNLLQAEDIKQADSEGITLSDGTYANNLLIHLLGDIDDADYDSAMEKMSGLLETLHNIQEVYYNPDADLSAGFDFDALYSQLKDLQDIGALDDLYEANPALQTAIGEYLASADIESTTERVQAQADAISKIVDAIYNGATAWEAYKQAYDEAHKVSDEEGIALLQTASLFDNKGEMQEWFNDLTSAEQAWLTKNSEGIMEAIAGTKEFGQAIQDIARDYGSLDASRMANIGQVWENTSKIITEANKGGDKFNDIYASSVKGIEQLLEGYGALYAIQNGTLVNDTTALSDAYSTLASATGLSADSLRSDLSPALWMLTNDSDMARQTVEYLANYLVSVGSIDLNNPTWHEALQALGENAGTASGDIAALIQKIIELSGMELTVQDGKISVSGGFNQGNAGRYYHPNYSSSHSSGSSGNSGSSSSSSSSTSTSKIPSEIERMVHMMEEIQKLFDYHRSMLNEIESIYSDLGQYTNLINVYEQEYDAIVQNNEVLAQNIAQLESLIPAQQELVNSMDPTDEGYQDAANDLERLQSAHQDYMQTLLQNQHALNTLTEAIKKARKAIRQTEIDLQNEIYQAIEDREKRLKAMADAELELQDTVFNLIKQRYQREQKMIEDNISAKKKALNEEKSALSEQLNLRKKLEDQEKKQIKLQQLEAKLARIAADPTRAKEAQSLRDEIAELREEMAWEEAEAEVEAQQESIEQQTQSLDDYLAYVQEYYEDLYEHPQKLIEEMKDVMSKTDDEILAWLQQNDTTYENVSAERQARMTEEWQAMLDERKGKVTTYWDEVYEIAALSDEEIINFLKENSEEYRVASQLQQEALEEGWAEMCERIKQAYLDTADTINAYHYDPIDIPVNVNTNTNTGGSGGGGGGSGGGSGGGGGNNNDDTTTTKRFLAKWSTAGYIPQGSITGSSKDAAYSKASDYITKLMNLLIADNPELKKLYQQNAADAKKSITVSQYAKGGYVKYTGPAWVDGSEHNPEAFLNAEQTRYIASLADALQNGTPMKSNTTDSMSIGRIHKDSADFANLFNNGLEHLVSILDPIQSINDDILDMLKKSIETYRVTALQQMPDFSAMTTGNTQTNNSNVTFGDVIVQVENLDTEADFEETAERLMGYITERMSRGMSVSGIRITG